ncbi:hypothetical protein N9D31_01065 [Oligoflexaceae bacterium]|nr:hypothetical protein [Oligoflexaceae bacterium]
MIQPKTLRVITTIALLGTLVSCGKSKSNHEPAPIAPEVEILGQRDQNGQTIVTYQSAQENAQYECRVDRGQQSGPWTECNDRNFAFNATGDVDTTFTVRAVNGDLTGEPQSIVIPKQPVEEPQKDPFAVSIAEKSDASQVQSQDGQYRISFSASGAESQNLQYMCKLDSGQFSPCQTPFQFQANQDGSLPNVSVYAIDPVTNQQSLEDIIYLSGRDQNGQYEQRVLAESVEVQLSDFYMINIPTRSYRSDTQFYISEQATSKTDNANLDVFRIMDGYDPRYIGNTNCLMEGFMPVNALTPSGQRALYCNGTPRGDVFKYLTDHRWARNHLELITEPEVTNQTGERTIAMFNAFDGENDLMQSRTRFDRECANSLSGIQYVGAARVFDDFFGRPIFAAIYTCQAQKSSRDAGLGDGTLGPALGGKLGLWTVSGAFIIRESEAFLPTQQSQCAPVQNGQMPCWNEIMPTSTSMLEVVIKSNRTSSTFISTGDARRLIEQLVIPIR